MPSSIKTILIAEDDEQIGNVLVQALTQETPYTVFLVSDGTQALEVVKTRRPSLLLLDYLLPVFNGIELAERLHAIPELEHVPAVLLTASFPPRGKVRNAGLVLLSKPFDLTELLFLVEQFLH